MEPATVSTVLEAISDAWGLPKNAEVSLEANPTSVETNRFRDYATAGVNRLSLGIQTLSDTDLRRLGRMHNRQDAIQAIEIAHQNFTNTSFDLIYARQHQTAAEWKDELTLAINLAANHLSLYQLTIEAETRFGEMYARGCLRGLPDSDLGADLYMLTQDICDSHGMPAYELSNHAVSGAECNHNLIYWRYGDYAGIGPGAHGRITLGNSRWATCTDLQPEVWLRKVNTGDTACHFDVIPPLEQAEEYLMMGLRLSEGVCLSRLQNLGLRISGKKIRQIEENGFLTRSKEQLSATHEGRLVLDAILRELLTEESL